MDSKTESIQEDSGLNQGIKRKPSEYTANNGHNSDDESSPNKRPKEDDPVVSIKNEPNSEDPVQIKSEPVDKDDEATTSVASTSAPPEIIIKTEPAESTTSGASTSDLPEIRIKTEPAEPATSVASTSDPPPETRIKTEPAESTTNSVKTEPASNADPSAAAVSTNGQSADDSSVSSSSTRPSCRFGIRCYRRNPVHKSAEAHPGDADYRRPDFPEPPLGTPPCPFGNACYRRNPIHFQQHSHPPDFNSAQNIRNRLRQREATNQQPDYASEDEEDDEEEDPFADENCDDADYRPGADIDDDDEEDELEFDSQRINSDDYD